MTAARRRAFWFCRVHLERPSSQLSQKEAEVPCAGRSQQRRSPLSGAGRPALSHRHADGTEVTSGSRCQAKGLPRGSPKVPAQTHACKPQSERRVCLEIKDVSRYFPFVTYSVLPRAPLSLALLVTQVLILRFLGRLIKGLG